MLLQVSVKISQSRFQTRVLVVYAPGDAPCPSTRSDFPRNAVALQCISAVASPSMIRRSFWRQSASLTFRSPTSPLALGIARGPGEFTINGVLHTPPEPCTLTAIRTRTNVFDCCILCLVPDKPELQVSATVVMKSKGTAKLSDLILTGCGIVVSVWYRAPVVSTAQEHPEQTSIIDFSINSFLQLYLHMA